MKLYKKWENRITYRTGRGTVNVKKDGNLAVAEVDSALLAKYLITVHGFSKYTVQESKPKPTVKMSKEPVAKSKNVTNKAVKPTPKKTVSKKRKSSKSNK